MNEPAQIKAPPSSRRVYVPSFIQIGTPEELKQAEIIVALWNADTQAVALGPDKRDDSPEEK